MAWSNSKVFAAYVRDALDGTITQDINSNTFTAALYNNSITPDNTVTAANSAYNAGQWATANEVSEAGQWAAGGVNLSSLSWAAVSATVTLSAGNTASGSAADLANVYGCLVYNNTLTTPVADQGLSYNYFGGANSVVNGTFTILWTNGVVAFAA